MYGFARGSRASIARFVSLEFSKIATKIATKKETKGIARNEHKHRSHAISRDYDTVGTGKNAPERRLI
jgi:hypothetical protein